MNLPKVHAGSPIELPAFGTGTVLETYESNNRQVFRWQSKDIPSLVLICKTFPEPNGNDAQRKIGLIQGYYRELNDAGVQVVPGGIIFTQKLDESGQVLVIQTEKYCGEAQESLLVQPTVTYEEACALMTSALRCCYLPLLPLQKVPKDKNKQPDKCRLKLGMDLLPRNIVSKKVGDQWLTTYVDLVPVKTIGLNGDHRLEWPEPTDPTVRRLGIFRHYNAAGLLIAYWCQLVKVRPEWGRGFMNEMKKFLRAHDASYVAAEVQKYFSTISPKVISFPPDKVRKLIAEWELEEILRLRVLACYIGMTRKSMEQVKSLLNYLFYTSHFQDGRIEGEKFLETKDLLVQIAALP